MTDLADLEYELALTDPTDHISVLTEMQQMFPQHAETRAAFLVELTFDDWRDLVAAAKASPRARRDRPF